MPKRGNQGSQRRRQTDRGVGRAGRDHEAALRLIADAEAALAYALAQPNGVPKIIVAILQTKLDAAKKMAGDAGAMVEQHKAAKKRKAN